MTRLFSPLAALALLSAAPVMAADPPVPAGKDPGGTAVALLTAGIDYTLPDIARVLARDGEGELIGWDVVDNDTQPFGPEKHGTALAKLFVGTSMGLVPVRADFADPMSLARASAFVARTPARVAILPPWSKRREDWEPFLKVALQLKDIVFVAMGAGEPLKPEEAASLVTPNVVPLTGETCAAGDTRETLKEVLALLCLHPRTP